MVGKSSMKVNSITKLEEQYISINKTYIIYIYLVSSKNSVYTACRSLLASCGKSVELERQLSYNYFNHFAFVRSIKKMPPQGIKDRQLYWHSSVNENIASYLSTGCN